MFVIFGGVSGSISTTLLLQTLSDDDIRRWGRVEGKTVEGKEGGVEHSLPELS